MFYLIQGVFFQAPGIYVRYIESRRSLVFQEDMLPFMYAGVFASIPPESEKEMTGTMADFCGRAVLFDIKLSETELSFTKQYLGREDEIFYSFRKQADGSWGGSFSGADVQAGNSHCILTPVSEEFFIPKY